jgi:hypothetical protein
LDIDEAMPSINGVIARISMQVVDFPHIRCEKNKKINNIGARAVLPDWHQGRRQSKTSAGQ